MMKRVLLGVVAGVLFERWWMTSGKQTLADWMFAREEQNAR